MPTNTTLELLKDNGTIKETSGDGSSFDKAIVVNADSEHIGGIQEMSVISHICHMEEEKKWEKTLHVLTEHKSKKYDVVSLKSHTGEEKKVFFDVSHYFGKY